MKKLLSKALILVFGLGVATTFTACHTGESSSATEVTKEETVTHSVSVTVLSSDGKALAASPVVKLNGNTMGKAADGSFFIDHLDNGTYTLDVTCTGFKSLSESVTLKPVVIEGITAGMNVVKTVYLFEETVSKSFGFGDSDEITIETTDHSYDDGTAASTTSESITVEAEIPTVTGADYTSIDAQIKAQSDNTEGVDDYKITLTNITSLEDAQAVAKANKVATSRMTRATTAMPENNELLTGVGVNAGPYKINMPTGLTFNINIKIPDDVKAAVTLFRTFKGDKWTPVTSGDTDIASIVNTVTGVITIKLNIVQTQSLAFGVIVNETAQEPRYEPIVADPVPSSVVIKTMTMPYKVKAGVVLTNEDSNSPALTDFLRKKIIRKYGAQVVKQAKTVTKNYGVAYDSEFHENGTLYLEGSQVVNVSNFSVTKIADRSKVASITAEAYGDAFIKCHEEYTEEEPVLNHGGGSN